MNLARRLLQGFVRPYGAPWGLKWRFGPAAWMLRCCYAVDRFSKACRVLEVRFWRKPLIRFYYSRSDYAPAPCSVTLRLTSNCNLRCAQCGQWGDQGVFIQPGGPASFKEMSTEDWRRVIAGLAPVCGHIYFFGGEPFLRKDCLELVAYAASRNVIAGVNTNGNFLKGNGHAIVDSGMDFLIVSLDGPRDINNRIRRGRYDVYESVIDGVEELVSARKHRNSRWPFIELNMTLTETNQPYIMETAEVAARLGIDYFAVTLGIFTTPDLAKESSDQFREEFGVEPHFYSGFVRDMSKMDPQLIDTQIRKVKRIWRSRYKQYPPIDCSFAEYFGQPAKPLVTSPCLVPWMTMQLMPNGDMAYCEDFPDLVTGNVRQQHPLALWNNSASLAWRRRIRTKGIFRAETRCCSYYLQ